MTDLALAVIGITKRFGALVAVEDCAFDLARGEVHALLGSNGCGKSTLCKVMAGALSADAGTVLLDGQATTFRGPLDARRGQIATVYQEWSLIPTLSVAENIALGTEPGGRMGTVDRAALRARAEALIGSVGALAAGLDPAALVGDLPIDRQQIVAILKALAMAPRVILFDESTSSLDRAQVDAFFALIRRLQSQAVSIIFISHRMEEVFAIADRVTVMRNGTRVGTRRTSETTRDDLVSLMVGGRDERGTRTRRETAGVPVLEVQALGGGRLSGITLALRPGEVLGLGGLHGQCQSEFLLSLFGALPVTSGQMTLAGQPHAPRGPHEAIRAGLAYVSGDRGRAGALHGRPILESMALSTLSRRGGFLARRGPLAEGLTGMIDRLKLKFGRLKGPIGRSGLWSGQRHPDCGVPVAGHCRGGQGARRGADIARGGRTIRCVLTAGQSQKFVAKHSIFLQPQASETRALIGAAACQRRCRGARSFWSTRRRSTLRKTPRSPPCRVAASW